MAENTSLGSTKAADATRGVPYYEKLKKDLRETLQKKRVLDKNMATLEDQIFRYEANYLEETSAGNIIKGFDNYIKGSSATGTATGTATAATNGGTSTRRKCQIVENDRVFSRSSASFMRELSPTSSAQTTPSHALTSNPGPATASASGRDTHAPSTNFGSTKAGQNIKKNKKGEKEEDEDVGKGPKRLKITYARGGMGD